MLERSTLFVWNCNLDPHSHCNIRDAYKYPTVIVLSALVVLTPSINTPPHITNRAWICARCNTTTLAVLVQLSYLPYALSKNTFSSFTHAWTFIPSLEQMVSRADLITCIFILIVDIKIFNTWIFFTYRNVLVVCFLSYNTCLCRSCIAVSRQKNMFYHIAKIVTWYIFRSITADLL